MADLRLQLPHGAHRLLHLLLNLRKCMCGKLARHAGCQEQADRGNGCLSDNKLLLLARLLHNRAAAQGPIAAVYELLLPGSTASRDTGELAHPSDAVKAGLHVAHALLGRRDELALSCY